MGACRAWGAWGTNCGQTYPISKQAKEKTVLGKESLLQIQLPFMTFSEFLLSARHCVNGLHAFLTCSRIL